MLTTESPGHEETGREGGGRHRLDRQAVQAGAAHGRREEGARMMDRHDSAIYRDEAYELLAELETSLLDARGRRRTTPRRSAGSSGPCTRSRGRARCSASTTSRRSPTRSRRSSTWSAGARLAVTRELIDLTLKARDRIKAMLDGDVETDSDRKDAAAIIASLRALVPGVDGREPSRAPAATPSGTGMSGGPEGDDVSRTYRIRFRPPKDVFLRGASPVALINELRGMGECTVVAETDAIPLLGDLNPEFCYTCWDLLLNTRRKSDAVKDVFIFVEDDSELSIDVVDYGDAAPDEYKNLGRHPAGAGRCFPRGAPEGPRPAEAARRDARGGGADHGEQDQNGAIRAAARQGAPREAPGRGIDGEHPRGRPRSSTCW